MYTISMWILSKERILTKEDAKQMPPSSCPTEMGFFSYKEITFGVART